MEKAVPHNGYLGLATWRRDGFMSLEAEYEGAVTTVPVSFTGGLLRLNAWTRFGGEVRVEVADAAEESMGEEAPAIAGRAFDDCDPVTGDQLEATVSWRGESDLSGLARAARTPPASHAQGAGARLVVHVKRRFNRRSRRERIGFRF